MKCCIAQSLRHFAHFFLRISMLWSMTLHPLVHVTVCRQPWSSLCHFFQLGLDKCMKSEVVTQSNMEDTLFWNVMPYILVDRYRHFGATCCLCHEGRRALNFSSIASCFCLWNIHYRSSVSEWWGSLYRFRSSIHCVFHLLWAVVRRVNMRLLDGLLR